MGQLDVLAAKDALNTMLETLIGQSRDALAVLAQDTIACADATDRATVESDRHLVLIMDHRFITPGIGPIKIHRPAQRYCPAGLA